MEHYFLEEHRVNLNSVDNKLTSSLSQLSQKLTQETSEINANHDIFRNEVEQKMIERNQTSDEKYEEIYEVLKSSEKRREAYFSDFKEDLKGLNLKIEEVLDSVGITIQDKLKETNMTIQNKTSQTNRSLSDCSSAAITFGTQIGIK